MKTALRAAVVATLASLVLAGVAIAASPQPTVGGTLSAAGRTITVLSNGNVVAHVTLTAEKVTLSETSFDIAPGQSHSVTFTGEPLGYVSALYAIPPKIGEDGGSATLSLNLKPYVPPANYSAGIIAILLIGGCAFLLLRYRPWRYVRIERPVEHVPAPHKPPVWAQRGSPPAGVYAKLAPDEKEERE
jgi:hypothetical protein